MASLSNLRNHGKRKYTPTALTAPSNVLILISALLGLS